jgi:hypothetical protein
MTEIFGVANVTNIGIQFVGNYYSCSRAIRERWFELSWIKGSWEIGIQFDVADLSKIYLNDGLSDEMEVCHEIIRQTVSGEKLERYFNSIQKLKRIRYNKFRRKQNNINILI